MNILSSVWVQGWRCTGFNMEFNEHRALAGNYDPITDSTEVMIPNIYIIMKNVYEYKVDGKFEKGQIVTVSGEANFMRPYYRAELVDAKEEDYTGLIDTFSKIFQANFRPATYNRVLDALSGVPRKLRKKLLKMLYTPELPTLTQEYSLVECLR